MTLPVAYPPLPDPLPSPVIDSHCHLDIGAAGRDGERGLAVDTALAAGEAVGVDAVIQVGVDVASSREAVRIAHDWAQVVAAVALHPNEAPGSMPNMAGRTCRPHGRTSPNWPRTTGLSRSVRPGWTSSARIPWPCSAGGILPPGIDLAKHLDKTLVIHDRDAHADILRIMDDEGAPRRVVMHCFSGDAAFAEAVTQRGWFCSFAGWSPSRTLDLCARRWRWSPRPHTGGDRRPVPGAHAVSRQTECLLPDPVDHPLDVRTPVGRPRRVVSDRAGQHLRGVRRVLMASLGPARIRELARELDLRPTKRLGQNFVIDPNTVRRIAALARVGSDDLVLEVGPGLGSLTLALLETGAAVEAVEIDPRLAARLPQTVAELDDQAAERLHVRCEDAVSMTASDLAPRVSWPICPTTPACRFFSTCSSGSPQSSPGSSWCRRKWLIG